MLLGGGIALFLVGEVVFRLSLGIRPVRYRIVAALVAIATTAVGVAVSSLGQLIALVGAIVIMLLAEAASRATAR